MKYIFYALYLLLFYLSSNAQTAYSTIEIGMENSGNINKNRFHRFWQPQPVPELFLITPAPKGYFVAGVSRHTYRGSPEYSAYFPYAGWGLSLPVFKFLSWNNSIRIGNYLMLFGDYESNETKKDESELGLNTTTGFGLSINKNFNVHISLKYFRIYTKRAIELTYLSAGLSYRYDTPAWLRNFLK